MRKANGELDCAVASMRSGGLRYEQIADALTISVTSVAYRARKTGTEYTKDEYKHCTLTEEARQRGRKKICEQARQRGEESCKEKAERFGLEYIGGYTHSDGYIKVKRLNCGHEFDLSCITLRDKDTKQIVCPLCAEMKRLEMEQRKRDEIEVNRIERMFASYVKRMQREEEKEKRRLQRVHRCPTCGKATDKSLCCSAECSRKYINRTHDQRRRAKLKDAMVDGDIQIAELFRRDEGICYLCGGKCDFNDCETRDDGTFVAGNNYPSIDHVVPLAVGGKHSWQNVRLAHHYCNTVKSDNLLSPAVMDLP